jgi:hypothetical protein
VRERSLLSQNLQFLWPSSDVMVDIARQSRASGLTVPQTLTAIVPMPEAEAMLAVAGEIARPTTP